jgi:hypothetical protein
MTRPRATTSPSDALGATIADLKARLARLENVAHQHNTPQSDFVRRAGDTMSGDLFLPGIGLRTGGTVGSQVFSYSRSETVGGWRDFATYTHAGNARNVNLLVYAWSQTAQNVATLCAGVALRSDTLPASSNTSWVNFQTGSANTQQIGFRVVSSSSSQVVWQLSMQQTTGVPQNRGVIVFVQERFSYLGFTPLETFPAGTTPTTIIG